MKKEFAKRRMKIWFIGISLLLLICGCSKSEKLVGAWELDKQDSGTSAEMFFIIKKTENGSLIKVSPTGGLEATLYIEERTEIRGDELILFSHPNQPRIKIFKLTNTELVLETDGGKAYYKKTGEEELKRKVEEERQRRKALFWKRYNEWMGR